jgi:hypothetical protein
MTAEFQDVFTNQQYFCGETNPILHALRTSLFRSVFPYSPLSGQKFPDGNPGVRPAT